MSSALKFILQLQTREEAKIVQSLLESNGIKTLIKADDAAGFYPQMDASLGVKIFVDEADYEDASNLLEAFTGNQDEDKNI